MTNVRTRFAPSPTGYIHVGNVRSALFPYLIARQNCGQFILRIEDTDQNRFVAGAEDLIIDVLHWLGMSWDEGPIGNGSETGDYGPYHQTERRQLYHNWAMKLVNKGLAYADPRSPEEIKALQDAAKSNHQLFLYRNNRPVNPPVWDGTQPLRFKVENPQDYHWHDEVMGDLSAGRDAVDDFIIMKSDGLPTYNFAHIVDDAEMHITHVIRGQEYISSMPKYLALYDALDVKWPIFAHLPHIMAPEGNKKLGKRDGAKSVTEYRANGYLAEAMVNFLASMGWNDGTEQEIFTMNELINEFSLDHVQKSGARFDEKRLLWLNGQWIKRLEFDDLFNRCDTFWGEHGRTASDDFKRAVLAVVRDRMKVLTDLPSLSEYFFTRPNVNWDIISTSKQLAKREQSDLKQLLQLAITKLETTDFNNEEAIQTALNELLDQSNEKPVIMFGIIRFALTWAQYSPGLPETMRLLGKDETLARLSIAVNL
ncbi:MAG: glutamate--tRNA ligase [Candidatus Saccharibacteria bacterium]|nr:glutamate--tRNA ligase [Candidatus Saccharibacteria bacterium]